MKVNEEWKQNKVSILENCVRRKFDQNPSLRDMLRRHKTNRYYEATADTLFGCGFRLGDAKSITAHSVAAGKYKNKMGLIPSKLRDIKDKWDHC